MKAIATFNEIENKAIQDLLKAFGASGANIRIGQINAEGLTEVLIKLENCPLEKFELKGGLFDAVEEKPEEVEESEEAIESVEGEIVN